LILTRLREAAAEGEFEFADSFFDAAVVAGMIGRAVEEEDGFGGEELIDVVVVEDAAVVAFEEKGLAVAGAEGAQASSL
jgi:hypothetical protein